MRIWKLWVALRGAFMKFSAYRSRRQCRFIWGISGPHDQHIREQHARCRRAWHHPLAACRYRFIRDLSRIRDQRMREQHARCIVRCLISVLPSRSEHLFAALRMIYSVHIFFRTVRILRYIFSCLMLLFLHFIWSLSSIDFHRTTLDKGRIFLQSLTV